MISYDVIGDYMSDLDDVRKRIEKRKRPLNDHNFKKLYNGTFDGYDDCCFRFIDCFEKSRT